jgi:hypothetical protein
MNNPPIIPNKINPNLIEFKPLVMSTENGCKYIKINFEVGMFLSPKYMGKIF